MTERSRHITKRRIFISVLFGLVSLLLSPYGISGHFGEVRLDVPWALFLPIMAAIAYGWRYGLLAGLAGGALYPFLLYPNNGWSCLSTAVVSILIYVTLGLTKKQKSTRKLPILSKGYLWALSIILAQISIYYCLLFNPILSLNPAFWSTKTLQHLPQEILYGITFKTCINFTILTIISETLLRLPWLRGVMGLEIEASQRSNFKIFIATITTSFLVWLTLLGLGYVLIRETNELYNELILLALFVIITSGFFVARTLFYYNEQKIENQSRLNKSEAKFKALYKNATDAIFILKEGLFYECNPTTLKYFNCTSAEITGRSPGYFSPFCQPNGDISQVKAAERISMALDGIAQRFEWSFTRLDGTRFEGEVLLNSIEIEEETLLQAIVRDITERKLAEKKLRESEERYKRITDGLTDYLYTVEVKEGKAIETRHSEACLAVTGYSSKEFLEDPYLWLKMIVAEDREWVSNKFSDILQGKLILPVEHQIMCKDGQIRWISDTTIPKYDSNGAIVSYDGVIKDITERKVAEEKLQQSEEKYRLIFDFSPFGILSYDENGGIVACNDTFAKIVGSPREWLIGLNMLKLPDRELTAAINNSLSGKIGLYEGNYHSVVSQKTTPIRAAFAPMDDANGIVRGGVCIVEDTTSGKEAEEKLRKSEVKLSTFFGSMSEMVTIYEMVYNENGEAINYRITECNNAYAKITGIQKEDAVGKLATEIYNTTTPPFLDEYARVAATGEPYEYNNYFSPLDKHFMVSVVSPAPNTFATITTDITTFKLIQEAINEKNEELENYLYVTSHDLRSPLVNIQGFSQRLQNQADLLNTIISQCQIGDQKAAIDKITGENIPKALDFIFSNVAKMDTLIKGLLQISRTGRIKMTIQKIDMNSLIKSVLTSYNFQISELSAKIILEELPDCYGDENLLNQLFSNIVGNALKYHDPERKMVLEISAEIQHNKIVYAFKDTGIGISPRNMDKIWDVFYRVDSAGPQLGEGIGLSLTRRITEKHKGKIWAESTEGIGTTFYISLQRNEFFE